MDETMPDALPLTKRFLSSLARFMEHEHRPKGEGDISPQVRKAIEQTEGPAEAAALEDGLKAGLGLGLGPANTSNANTSNVDTSDDSL